MDSAPIQIVDEHDKPVGQASKQEAWDKGLYHRTVRIMVEDEQGRILLQKRAAGLELYPNYWDYSASGHVDAGETYDQAAARELREEVGIDLPLEAVASYQTKKAYQGRILNRFNRTYRARLPKGAPFHPQLEEVSELRWFTPDAARQLLEDRQEQVTDSLRQAIKDHYGNDL